MTMNRAYSVLEIKGLDDEQRVITGIATTPSTDRMGDIVEPLGIKFKNPLPLLWQHQHDKPVGTVKFDKPTAKGVTFTATLADVQEDGVLKERIDEAWQSLKAKLIRGVSIGFRALEYGFMDNGGIRFTETEVIELSLVTIPANADATIHTIKSVDTGVRAALGLTDKGVGDSDPRPGVSGKSNVVSLKSKKEGKMSKKTIGEQIADYKSTREKLVQKMDSIMEKSSEEGETLDSEQSEAYDQAEAEVEAIDKHLERLGKLQKAQGEKATPVAERGVQAQSDSGVRVAVQKDLPKGTAFTRYAMALAAGRGSTSDALEYAKRWDSSTPQVSQYIKAVAGTTTDAEWAAPLVDQANLVGEFIELLRPETLLGKMQGFRRVPFNRKIPVQTGGSTIGWVGEGAVKPVGELAFDTVTLGFNKVAGIVVLTEELARFSDPSAEEYVRRDLVAQTSQFLDNAFINPALTANAGINPASITNQATEVPATGTDADAFLCDLSSLQETFLVANLSVGGTYLVMSSVQAARLALFRNALGQYEFPQITANGGFIGGIPVVTSENVPTASDGTSIIALVKPSEILLADDGSVTLDASREATLDMNGGASPTFNLWQRNCVGIRAERYITWAPRRAAAVAYISGANYSACATS